MILPMTDQLTQTSFLSELLKELRDVWRSFTVAISNSGVSLRNQLRMVQKAELDYIVMPIGGPLPERDAPPRSFIQRQLPLPPDPLSLETLDRRLQAVADAGNVRLKLGFDVFYHAGFGCVGAGQPQFGRGVIHG
jgi:hypothetical protein